MQDGVSQSEETAGRWNLVGVGSGGETLAGCQLGRDIFP